MNKKSILFKSIALTSVFVLNVGLYMSLNRVATELDAYSIDGLPTTINLNDCNEQTIRSYYSGLNSLVASERQGTNLLKNLKNILKNGQKYLAYDGTTDGKDIWDVYCIVDRDWDKSPASALPSKAGTYNPSTNTITNYHWGRNTDKYENPYLHVLYYNRENEPVAQAYGDHRNGTNNPKGINREHIWPKGAGFNSSGAGGARGDIMHLWAAHGHTNNKHSNFYYGNVDKSRDYDDEKTDTAECAGNYLGYSETLGGNTKVFEPQDCDKGDIARACFYMAARYNNWAGNDNNIDSNNPNLELVNNITTWKSGGYDSTSSSTGKVGIIQDLLEWNRLDPPDEFEIHRNNLCYNNFTNNRNPFIDFPSWADAIWGTVEDGNYNPTPSGSVSPASDPVSGIASTFAISSTSLELEVDDTATLFAKNADGDIHWSVNNDLVVELNKSVTANNESVTITALSTGSATITATCGGDSVSCSVTVSNSITNYGTLVEPLSVDEALSVIQINDTNATNEQLYVKGIVTSNTAYNNEYNNYDEIWLKNDLGFNEQALSLFRIRADEDVRSGFLNANDMVGKEVVVHGYGLHYTDYGNDKYEICKANSVSPYILSIKAPGEVEDYTSNVSPYVDLLGNESSGQGNVVEEATFSERMSDQQALGDTFALGDVNLAGAKGTHVNAVPKYYTNDGATLRLYAGNTLTFTSTYNISRIEFTFMTGKTSEFEPGVGSFSLNGLSGVWTGSATSVVFSVVGTSRITHVSVTYSKITTTVTNVALRFGIVFPKADWTSIHSDWPISDYGVMIVSKDTLNDTYGVETIAEAYNDDDYLLDIHRGSYAEPWSMDEDNYAFTVKLSITLTSNYRTTYYAAPYIIAGGEHYFLCQIETSVKDLADYYLEHGGSSLSNAALTLLSETI